MARKVWVYDPHPYQFVIDMAFLFPGVGLCIQMAESPFQQKKFSDLLECAFSRSEHAPGIKNAEIRFYSIGALYIQVGLVIGVVSHDQGDNQGSIQRMTPEEIDDGLRRQGYIADRATVKILQYACLLDKPLLVEGPAGAGKTGLAKAWSRVLGRELIRLQCYEGINRYAFYNLVNATMVKAPWGAGFVMWLVELYLGPDLERARSRYGASGPPVAAGHP